MPQPKKYVNINGLMKLNPEWKSRPDSEATTTGFRETPVVVPHSVDQKGPKKYIKVGGVIKLNPEYKRWKEKHDGGVSSASPVTTVKNPEVALPVISNMEDYKRLNADVKEEIALSESTTATIEMMQDPEIALQAGMQPDKMLDQLGAILSKYEVPLGLMNKLFVLSEYQRLEFMIDDSGSMSRVSDTVNRGTNEPQTRWAEARVRLKEMIEVVAYVPFQQIIIEFLNRPDRISLAREGRDPAAFIADAHRRIDRVFGTQPGGTTPALERLRDSIRGASGASVALYFFGDGVPNGGEEAQRKIIDLLMNRQNPPGNPITFLSCTNEDSQVEWMKDAEEVIPFCSESDDFDDESREVIMDQGAAIPYTRGFHLICQLVAAMNPEDLDAMDESVPFTKAMLDNLLGVRHNSESYHHYFDNFVKAQQKRKIESPADVLKKNTRWKIEDFLETRMSHQIPQVQEYKRELARRNRALAQSGRNRALAQSDLDPCCCVS